MHCAAKIVSACLHAGSTSAERVGQEKLGGVTPPTFPVGSTSAERVGQGKGVGSPVG